MPGSREKVEKTLRELIKLYDDPNPGNVSWMSLESVYLQKLCNALGKLGFRYNVKKKN